MFTGYLGRISVLYDSLVSVTTTILHDEVGYNAFNGSDPVPVFILIEVSFWVHKTSCLFHIKISGGRKAGRYMHLCGSINTQQVHAGANKAITKVILHTTIVDIMYGRNKRRNILELEHQRSWQYRSWPELSSLR
jgi:hypothetical protein